MATLGADSKQPQAAQQFLNQVRQLLLKSQHQLAIPSDELSIIGPLPALMERRAGRHRAHLIIKAPSRAPLQRCLQQSIPLIEGIKKKSDLRWQIDIDPQDTL